MIYPFWSFAWPYFVAAVMVAYLIGSIPFGLVLTRLAGLGDDEAELRETIETTRADEAAHREEALAHEAEQAPGYELLTGAIKTGSRLAIWLSPRI